MKPSTRTLNIVLACAVLALLGARFWYVLSAEAPLLPGVGRMAVVSGAVADDIDVRESGARVVVEVSTVNGESAEGKVLATLPRETRLQYGDQVEVRGMLEAPQEFETQTGRVFDYPGYLTARGVSYVLAHAELRSTRAGEWSVLRTLFALKHRFEQGLEKVMSEPMAALMEGLLLGEKSGLPKALTQAFVLAGLVHIVVLSGYNIGVVAEWALRFFAAFLPRKVSLVAVAAIIVLFACMAGGGMATIRAAIMGVLAILARFLRRSAAALRALIVAVVLMLLYNPLALFDVGFMLSVLATFGLITLAPAVEARLRFLPEGGIRSIAATTIAVQFFVLPALLYFTGVLSIVSLPVNVLVLPFVPLAMLLGFVAGLLALVHPLLALLPGFAADLLLRAGIFIAEIASALPLAAFVVPPFPAWIAALCYLPLIAVAMRLHWRNVSRPPTN